MATGSDQQYVADEIRIFIIELHFLFLCLQIVAQTQTLVSLRSTGTEDFLKSTRFIDITPSEFDTV
jgi:hypothetical protein